MQTLWNWLMRTNAKALFVACLLALLVLVGWRGYVEYAALRDARGVEDAVHAPAKLPDFPPYKGLGIQAYVEAQARRDTLALPVDLFRPSLDSMVSNLVNAILNDPGLVVPPEGAAAAAAAGGGKKPEGGSLFDVDPAAAGGGKGGQARRSRQPPPPQVTYHGVFKRTDDRVAAWITEANSRTTRFFGEGDTLFGATLERVTVDSVDVRLPDGTLETLPRGGSLTFPAAAAADAAATPAAAGKSEPAQAAPREAADRRDGGLFRRGGVQRLPTAEELAAIERANPEKARLIREAIRLRQDKDRQRGANP